jgi:hypothetical protein
MPLAHQTTAFPRHLDVFHFHLLLYYQLTHKIADAAA